MNNISMVSEVTANDVADYLNITELTTSDTNTLNTLIKVAKAYMTKYTGQPSLDIGSDLVIVLLILVQDMWDNRTLYVDSANLNKVVESILGMYSINLLPEVENA